MTIVDVDLDALTGGSAGSDRSAAEIAELRDVNHGVEKLLPSRLTATLDRTEDGSSSRR